MPAVVHYPRSVLVAALAFLVLAGVLGAGVSDQLKVGGFDDPGSESSQAEQILLRPPGPIGGRRARCAGCMRGSE